MMFLFNSGDFPIFSWINCPGHGEKHFSNPKQRTKAKKQTVCPEQRRFSGFGRFQASFQGSFPRSFLKLDHFFFRQTNILRFEAQNVCFLSMQDGCSSVDTNRKKSYCTSSGCPPRCRLTTFHGFHSELQPLTNQPPLNTFPRKGTGLLTSIKSTTRVSDETVLRGDRGRARCWWLVVCSILLVTINLTWKVMMMMMMVVEI